MNQKIITLAKDIINGINHVTTADNPSGSGYFTIFEQSFKNIYGDDITLQVAIECRLYEDELDHHLYYGLYSIPEISDGDDIGESDWSYTKEDNVEQLANLIEDLCKTFTRNYLWNLYKNTIAA